MQNNLRINKLNVSDLQNSCYCLENNLKLKRKILKEKRSIKMHGIHHQSGLFF